MTSRTLGVLALGLATSAALASELDYHEGMKALAAHDYSTALSQLEGALKDDPNNLRYGSDYRQASIQAKEYDRCLKFFERLVAEHPDSANAHLNYGFAYVDKIPASGSITQVILANTALAEFTKSIELSPSWIALYTRGNSYLYWPKIFNRAHLGVADLEEALKIQQTDGKRSYYVRTYISLGDGYWKTDDLVRANRVWKEGSRQFPDNAQLKARLSKDGDELKALIDGALDPSKRVNTDLSELWTQK
jgi:tetratricopeptide (TPR) repeat protein